MSAPNPHDQLHYTGRPYTQTHPDRLAALGTMYGMKPAPVDRCRVLELGCGDGGNLLPMAYTLPGSEFVGVDLAAKPVAMARTRNGALGLTNVRLYTLDVMDFAAEHAGGTFDYIIAHGLYSWVPPEAREKILAICGEHLAPQGIAYISYKVYPGGHLADMEREMMRYHAGRFAGASEEEQIRQGVGLLKFLADAKPGEPDTYRRILRESVDSISKRLDGPEALGWFYHDAFAPFSESLYFHRFIERAAGRGLQFLSEARLQLLNDDEYTPATLDALRVLGDDVVAREQYLDFLSCNQFRRTLLCRAGIELDRSLDPECVRGLYVTGDLKPGLDEPLADPNAPEKFMGHSGREATLNHPITKAAFRRLAQAWPAAVPVSELEAAASGSSSYPRAAEPLLRTLLASYVAGLIELVTRIPPSATQVSERPIASAMARLQIANGPRVTSLRHREVLIDGVLLQGLLLRLDGHHDRADLLRELCELAEAQSASADGQSRMTRQEIDAGLDSSLRLLLRLELLVG